MNTGKAFASNLVNSGSELVGVSWEDCAGVGRGKDLRIPFSNA
jgi:hypothetical protein